MGRVGGGDGGGGVEGRHIGSGWWEGDGIGRGGFCVGAQLMGGSMTVRWKGGLDGRAEWVGTACMDGSCVRK